MVELLTYLFLAILSAYLIIAIFSFTESSTPAGFFTVPDNTRMRFSAIFGGVTLGTGFAYQSTSGTTFGFGAFVSPAGVLLGFWALSRLEKLISLSEEPKGGKIPSSKKLNYASYFDRNFKFSKIIIVFNIVRVIVFTALIAFELWVSAQYISAIFNLHNTHYDVFFIALILGGIATIYTVIGGFPAALKTDIIQGISVIVLLLLLGYFSLAGIGKSESNGVFKIFLNSTPQLSLTSLIGMVAVFLTAFSTQLYSIINSVSSRTRTSLENVKNFWISGVCQSLLISIIVIIGLSFTINGSDGLDSFVRKLTQTQSLSNMFLSAIILFGFTSIIFTTIDTAIVAICQLTGDSFGFDPNSEKDEIWPRIFCGLIGLVATPLALGLLYLQTGILQTLFTILTPLGAIATYIASCIFLNLTKGSSKSDSNLDFLALAFIVIITIFSSINLINEKGALTPILTVIAFAPAIVVFARGLFLRRRMTIS